MTGLSIVDDNRSTSCTHETGP